MIDIFNSDCADVLDGIFDTLKEREVIMVSDVPFNMGYKYSTYKDRMPETEYLDMIKKTFSRDVPFVIIHYPESLYKISSHIGVTPTRVCSWVYNSNTPRQHRDVAFFGVQPDFSKVSQPYKNPNDKRIKKRIEEGKTCKLYDWWNINQIKNVSKEKTAHPCQMPLDVMKNVIGILPDNAVIIDPFMGSGTTGVACKELGRDFIGIEVDPFYYGIAKSRLAL